MFEGEGNVLAPDPVSGGAQRATPSLTFSNVFLPAALGGVLTFFFHHDTDFPEILAFTHDTNKRYGCVTPVAAQVNAMPAAMAIVDFVPGWQLSFAHILRCADPLVGCAWRY
jgi:hypothetical protein